jgi:hypothetical protein
MSVESDEHDVRAARNQSTFRAANEKLHAIEAAFGEIARTYVIACECADVTCIRTIEIEAAGYRDVRASPRRFAVLPGHVYPDVEIMVSEFDDYAVVEKVAKAGEIVEATDPRRVSPPESS